MSEYLDSNTIASKVTIRLATIKDETALTTWANKPHIREAVGYDWDWSSELTQRRFWVQQYITCYNEKPIGFFQVINTGHDPDNYWKSLADIKTAAIDIWIGEERFLGKGIGTFMMQYAIERCFADPEIVRILLDPLKTNIRARRFYERIGFEFYSEMKLDGEVCSIYQYLRS